MKIEYNHLALELSCGSVDGCSQQFHPELFHGRGVCGPRHYVLHLQTHT